MDAPVWLGIAFCVTQSAMFSGLNLAFFGVTRLQLELEAENNEKAARVLRMRKDSNFLLTTILWGNVGINVLLTLLSGSVLAGVSAFVFSTVVITFLGEILPQAYFSRNSLRMASLLAPFLRFYQVVLYVVAKPSALVLDAWLGKESVEYFREQMIRDMLIRHVEAHDSDVGHVEGVGALNFLDIDDLEAQQEGEEVEPKSILVLEVDVDLPRFPAFEREATDPFIAAVHASGKKWVILVDGQRNPLLALDADEFLRDVMLKRGEVDPYDYCHRPIVLAQGAPLSDVMRSLRRVKHRRGGVMENDLVLVWKDRPRIITGADLLDRLLRGVR